MSNSRLRESRMTFLSQVLGGFFKTIGENRENIDSLLLDLRGLRQEYLKLLKEDVIIGLLQDTGEGAISNNISRERLATLLEKLIASFRADQEKSYQFLEQNIWQKILGDISQRGLEEGFSELTQLKKGITDAQREKSALVSEGEELSDSLQQWKQKCADLQKERDNLQKKVQELSKSLEKTKDLRDTTTDYEIIIREIRKELEGKKTYDHWRLKIFYNKVASMTNSTWSYPAIPKPDPFVPKSKHARKFLESL